MLRKQNIYSSFLFNTECLVYSLSTLTWYTISILNVQYVYKSCWTPSVGVKLKCKKVDREEALDYYSHAVGVFKGDLLIGHVPIEISALTDYFLKESEENYVDAIVIGKRKREIGLVVPARYTAVTIDK